MGFHWMFIEFPSDAMVRWPDGSFDLIFIDGDHSYAAVREDLQLWRPKVRAEGFLAGAAALWMALSM